MRKTDARVDVEWKEWSEESFEQAKEEGKLVLLDLTASWCHWCHVMDKKTYSDADIASTINKDFIPIRVDIDKRPDISERYNRGGFPTTAFLSDRGESVWGATFVPPPDMKRIMEAILNAKHSGEIERALERSRIQPLRASRGGHPRISPNSDQLLGMLEDIIAAYDVEWGGFGVEPKFPHPDAIELLLIRYVETKDNELLDAAVHSIERMASGLHDKVEGGVFRYSVSRDWMTPHYEKMLETNVGFLRNLVHAHGIVSNHGFDMLAKDIAKYVLTNLQNTDNGGFYGSQDADEEYYRLDAIGRRKADAPSIDKTVYAGWSAEASAVFVLAGTVLEDEEMIVAGERAWRQILRNLWNPTLGLVRHFESDETYLFEDQIAFLRALIAQLTLSKDDIKIGLAEQLVCGVDKAFASVDGGYNDIVRSGRAIGELDTPRRSLVENSNWALLLAQLGSAVHRQDLLDKARDILDSFTPSEIGGYGVFAASYLKARLALDKGIAAIEIHVPTGRNPFRIPPQGLFDPTIVRVVTSEDDLEKPYAVVCTERGCSEKIGDPEGLLISINKITASRTS